MSNRMPDERFAEIQIEDYCDDSLRSELYFALQAERNAIESSQRVKQILHNQIEDNSDRITELEARLKTEAALEQK